MIETPFVDDLLASNPLMRVRDKEQVEALLKKIVAGGLSKLQVVTDFDYTLTKTRGKQGHLDCSWGVLQNPEFLSSSYIDEVTALKNKYLPIELDPYLSVSEKIPHMEEWWQKATESLQRSGLHKDIFKVMVDASNLELRDDTDTLFQRLADAKVPVLVFSAGVGDLIEEILHYKNQYHPNIKIVSNFLTFDNAGHVTGLKGEVIHVFNKNENSIQDSDYFTELQFRNNVILLGDSVGDLDMCKGLRDPGAVLKIGFLNHHVNERLDNYLDLFDIVLLDDQSMSTPVAILEKVV